MPQNLFDVIPERLFSVLASPLRRYYSDVLFLIYQQYRRNRFNIDRQDMVQIIADYIEEEQADQYFNQALDEEIWNESLDNPKDARDKANFILRKLEDTGWISIETATDYRQYIMLADWSVRLMETLDRLKNPQEVEYQGFVYATYSALYADYAETDSHIALEQACWNTEQLNSSLKSLYQNIKRHTEQVLNQRQTPEILKLHFDEYQKTIIDKSYHRLKTSDSVFKYRPQIVAKVNQWYNNYKKIEEIARLDMQRERYDTLDEAVIGVRQQLDFIRESYMSMDDMLNGIDKRNSQYANASYMQVKYGLFQSNADTSGQLMAILNHLADGIKNGRLDRRDMLDDGTAELFSIFSQAYMDENSIYKPRAMVRNHQPEAINEVAGPTREQKEQALCQYKRRIESLISKEKINRLVMDCLNDRADIAASEMDIEEIEDLINLIYIADYANAAGVDYSVEFNGRPMTRTQNGAFEFKDIKIKKKG
jgi:hypothetical protein